jgi:hypothetical protein
VEENRTQREGRIPLLNPDTHPPSTAKHGRRERGRERERDNTRRNMIMTNRAHQVKARHGAELDDHHPFRIRQDALQSEEDAQREREREEEKERESAA